VSAVLARVGDKWSVLIIIMLLGDGPKTSMRSSGGISQRMLTLTLPGLQQHGLVTRAVFPTIPPRVDYELTDLGRSLWKPVEALGSWAREHLTEIETAKRRFTSAPRRIERAG
jgi:DNA-binding HxlR family transcriptional regulator